MPIKGGVGPVSVLVVNLSSLPALLTAAAILRVAGSPPETRILLMRELDPDALTRAQVPCASQRWVIGFSPDNPTRLQAFVGKGMNTIEAVIGGGKEEVWRSVLGDGIQSLSVPPSSDPALLFPAAALRVVLEQEGEGTDAHTRGLLEIATMAAHGTTVGAFSDYFRAAVGWEGRALYAIRHFARHVKPDPRIARWVMAGEVNEDESLEGLQSFRIVCGAMAENPHIATEFTRLMMAPGIDDAPLEVVSEGYFHRDGRILPFAPLDPAKYLVREVRSIYRGSRRIRAREEFFYFAFPPNAMPHLLTLSHGDQGPDIGDRTTVATLHESTLIWQDDAWIPLSDSRYYAELHRPVDGF